MTTTKDFEDAKEYLESIDKWEESYNVRLSGYEIIAIANTYRKERKNENSN